MQDEKVEGQKFGLAPFDPKKEVVELKSWDQKLSSEEMKETDPLMERIRVLQTTVGEELSGVQIIALFLRRRIQPLQARASAM
jgi:hypothetical protein